MPNRRAAAAPEPTLSPAPASPPTPHAAPSGASGSGPRSHARSAAVICSVLRAGPITTCAGTCFRGCAASPSYARAAALQSVGCVRSVCRRPGAAGRGTIRETGAEDHPPDMRTSMRCAPLTCSSMHQLRGGAFRPQRLHHVLDPHSASRLSEVQLPPLPLRSNWTCRVPHPVLTGHATSLTPY
jgi:hypothetical protein